ncbi:hypothetical protein ACIQOU_29120 [Streptomyces sp. NPDC091279]|uniref:hypothetical protein n=1 Tax=unclassified Streptomyces TaxID=2593676 RepID=UPI00381DD3DA
MIPLAEDDPGHVNPSTLIPQGGFDPTVRGTGGEAGALDLLGYLMWGVSAAAVAGVIIIGTQLALQLRRGEPGEGATYFRGLFFVLGGCVVAISAFSIVDFLIG